MLTNNLINSELDLEAIAVEVARNEAGARLPISELLAGLGIDEDWFVAVTKDPVFKKKVSKLKKQIEDDGVSFSMKAHISAEASLPTVHRIVNHPDTPPMAALKGMELLTRWASLDKTGVTTDGAGTGFSLNINLSTTADAQPKITVEKDVTPETAFIETAFIEGD